jgi:hypothetical protein
MPYSEEKTFFTDFNELFTEIYFHGKVSGNTFTSIITQIFAESEHEDAGEALMIFISEKS